jgi:hypothetical protein
LKNFLFHHLFHSISFYFWNSISYAKQKQIFNKVVRGEALVLSDDEDLVIETNKPVTSLSVKGGEIENFSN